MDQKPPGTCLEFIERWPWFRALPDDLRLLVLNTATERTAGAGDTIARAGEPCTHWYGLVRGVLQMYVIGQDGTESTLYCLREGEWGGEGSLLKNEPRRYDLRALAPSQLCLLPTQTFETLRRSSIEFNHFLCEIMNARMGEFVGMLAASRLQGPEMQVARGLLMLVDLDGPDAQELAVSQQDLALICGLSRQRVNIAISVFKRRDIVRSEPNRSFLIVRMSRLRSFVTAEG
jgi:CRP/FNR family transcriptional regulator, cyclic AMP receptor protein